MTGYRQKLLLGAGVAVILGILVAGAAVIVAYHPTSGRRAAVSAPSFAPVADPASPTAEPPTTAPPATSPSPSPKKSKAARSPAPPPTKKATQIAGPPPPPTKPTATTNCPTFLGTAASGADVKAALDTAAARQFWGSKPAVRVPRKLLYAVAFTESSWRSTVVSCDGGRGLMQVMPDTATWMNQRFGTSWQIDTLAGNAYLGGQYLAWLVAYFGEVYWNSAYGYLDESTGEITNEALLNSVIAAYNYGYGAVDPTKGAAGIPNPSYVATVRRYLESCPCPA